jgi:hypothetical protein
MTPARGPKGSHALNAQLESVPDRDTMAQPSPDCQIDQRISWSTFPMPRSGRPLVQIAMLSLANNPLACRLQPEKFIALTVK